MRVLQLLPALHVGGVETGVVDLAIAMKTKGHEPHVISNGGALVTQLLKREIPHLQLPVHRKSLLQMCRLVPIIARYIRAHRIEVVHARSRVPGWIGYWACRMTGAKFVTTCHGHYATHLLSRVMAWGRLVIVPSHVIGRHMMESFGVSAEHIRLIPRGVNLRKFTYQELSSEMPATFRIGLIGRLTPLKGHVVLLRAAVQVVRALPRVTLLIVGEPSPGKEAYHDELAMWVRRLGLARSVEFVGACHDVPGLLKTLDLVVVPSTQPESFGRTAIEAQAAGVPVVASSIGGLAEVIADGTTGLLVPPNDPSALAKAMLRVLTDRPFARALSVAGRQAVEQTYPLRLMVQRTVDVYAELLKTTRVLIIKLSAIGDVILVSPSLRAIRQQFRHAQITCLVGLAARPLVQRCPYVDDVVVDDAAGQHRGFPGAWRLGRQLRRHGFDLVFDLQSSRRSRLIGWATGAPTRYGYANHRWSRLLTHRAPGVEQQLPPVQHQFQLLNFCGVTTTDDSLECWTGPEDVRAAERLCARHWLSSTQPLVAMHPGASQAWSTKRWSAASWAALCDLLARDGVRTILTGTAHERELGDAIVQAARSKPIVAMGETSLGGLACIFQRCNVVVTLDTAPLHLAAAVRTPTVVLYGPTDPRRHTPPAPQLTVLWKQVSCSPCYQRRCPLSEGQQMQCMTSITPSEVAAVVRAYVKSEGKQIDVARADAYPILNHTS